jgi:hypothetical protein
MKCDCIKDIESRLADFMRPKAGDNCTAKAQGTVFYVDGSSPVGQSRMESTLQIPFRVKGSAKGYTSERGKEIGCNVNYCPFCGRNAKRHVVGEDAGLAAAMGSAS